jgi:hypothetical protein
MPELWIPYGSVETLITIQAENLGTVAEPTPEGLPVDAERMTELTKGAAAIFVNDAAPATVELLRAMALALEEAKGVKLISSAPKRIENAVPGLKGRITTLPPPLAAGDDDSPVYAQELTEKGAKLFVGSARPDPLFGMIDSKVEACLNWVARSHTLSARARKGMEPQPFQKTEAYEEVERLVEHIPEAGFLTAVPRGGKIRAVMENAPFDAIKNAFARTPMAPARGLVVGAGGRGFDDTLSSAIRSVWGVLPGVRRTGTVLLVAECSEGMGSSALEMLVTGRISGEGGKRREKYVEGLEEVFYLNKLRDEYDVLLLSGLPETYARSKLGLTTARGAGEAVGRVLNKVGRTGKLNVVPRGPECFVESA